MASPTSTPAQNKERQITTQPKQLLCRQMDSLSELKMERAHGGIERWYHWYGPICQTPAWVWTRHGVLETEVLVW